MLTNNTTQLTQNEHLANFVQTKKWDWFLTFTTEYDLSYNSARRFNNRYFKNIHSLGKNSFFSMFYTIEPHKIKGGTHIHALLSTEFDERINDGVMFRFLLDQWKRTSGKNSKGTYHRNKIGKIKGSKEAVSRYCVKYITKETQLHWDYLISGMTNFIN